MARARLTRFLPLTLPRMTPRAALVLAHDLAMTAAAIVAACYIRFEGPGVAIRLDFLWIIVPAFVGYAGLVYLFSDLYRAKWRFASLPDLFNIVRASTILGLSLLALDYVLVSENFYGALFFGKITIGLYWFLQIFFLGAPRLVYRYLRYAQSNQIWRETGRTPALIVGEAAEADILLRSIENGTAADIHVAGILSPSRADRGQALRGVEVVGSPAQIERAVARFEARAIRISRIILMPSALAPGARPEDVLMQARRLGITASRAPSLELGDPIRLAPIDVEDLLLRPSVAIDHDLAGRAIAGKSVIVTGGGGSIGSELCRRIVSYGAARLLVIENSEPALHAITEALSVEPGACSISGRIADVRDRDRIHRLFAQFEPDLVFHAAALKHVPIVELDWAEGVKTNVFGTVNVADAATMVGAEAMIMISTDKAIEPQSMLGATKRFAELYCQALDIEHSNRTARDGGPRRLISVRFGNVLNSNGSVVPKFKAQIEAGGPVTVTHPDMVRYFMTIREACDLVVSATGHALRRQNNDKVSVYVLNMGQPVRIRELAEHLIRLHGLEPMIDIDIVYTGTRPGERIEEILFAEDEENTPLDVAGIVAARGVSLSAATLLDSLALLREAIARDDRRMVYRVLGDTVPDFRGAGTAERQAS